MRRGLSLCLSCLDIIWVGGSIGSEIFLDGYREMSNGVREYYEFYGCYYHSCTVCFPDRSKVGRCKHRENGYLTVERAYFDTMDRERSIKHLMNFNESVDKWIVMWEHDFNEKELMMRNELGETISLNLVGKMNLRDAVKGGQMEVFWMYAVVNDPSRQSIHYLDINSLYPYVMVHTEFPVGHPKIRRGDYSCRKLLSDLK